MLVSALKQSSPGRFKIILENGEEIRSTLSAITDCRLYAGKDLDAEALEQVRHCSMQAISRETALQMVSRRQMSQKELRDKLLHKGADEETAEYCAQWLTERGFINDENYSKAIVRHYAAKGYGKSRIKGELIKRGIDRDLMESALEEMPQQDEKIIKYISARLKNPNDRDEVKKLSAALYRRGYSFQEIRRAFESLDAEIEEY